MNNKIKTDDKVFHDSFGEGVVLNILDEETLWVEFGTLRTFVKPEHCKKVNK